MKKQNKKTREREKNKCEREQAFKKITITTKNKP